MERRTPKPAKDHGLAVPTSSRLRIQERFVSVQGEGALVGVPSRFIRISGCNLRCAWCDSPESSWNPKGEPVELDSLLAEAGEGPRHVVVTGGEPLLFGATRTLVRRLREQGHHVTIETAGTVWLDDFRCDLMSISPKLAHSTPAASRTRLAARHEQTRFSPEAIRRLLDQAPEVQLKYVVRAEEIEADLDEIQAQLRAIGAADVITPERIFLMPEGTDAETLAHAYRKLHPHCQQNGYRLGLRLHIALFGHRPGT